MKRNNYFIYIETPSENIDFPSITPVPWNGSEPDFAGIEEPTLSILQNAWDKDKNNIEIIPDPVPFIETPIPDWQGFGGTLQQSEIYISNINNPFLLMLTSFIIQFAGSGDNPSLYQSFSIAWTGFVESTGGLSKTQIAEINTACNAFNMKFKVSTNGLLTFI